MSLVDFTSHDTFVNWKHTILTRWLISCNVDTCSKSKNVPWDRLW